MRAVRFAVAIAALCVATGIAHADDFFASSPGALSASHASIDSPDKCNDCHVNGSKAVSDQQCLSCHDHKDLAARIAKGVGFHVSPIVKGKECKTCHSEHKGRGFNLMGWASVRGGETGFDHGLTGWPLNGKHASTDCAKCHKASNKQGLRTYMGTDKLCGSSGCHAKDQPHKFERRDLLACERCHGESVWKPQKSSPKFDHNDRKDAAMPILGSHKDVSCTKCHPKAVFNLPFAKPQNCGNAGCHNSPHGGHLFNTRDCDWCHSPTFKSLKNYQIFDHTERTRFDLGQAHKKIKCYDCHTKSIGEAKPTGACEQCHAKDNKHGDRFKQFGSPPACGVCHPSGGPKFTPNVFSHGGRTKFNLQSKHAQVTCRRCHRGKGPADFEKFAFDGNTQCMGCHEHAKVHADDDHPGGKYTNKQCLGCHVNAGNTSIKQGKSNQILAEVHGPQGTFPLIKKHKDVPCAECHRGRDAKGRTSFGDLKPNCNAAGQCHEDSLHEDSLGKKCLLCHVSGTWDALNFDHDKPFPSDAKGKVGAYPLKGEHKKNKCEACHPDRKYAETNVRCADEGCHAQDDAHKGRLGNKCEQCHLETGDNLFNHNTMSSFRLDGKHLNVRCTDCHPSVTFKPRPKTCFGCHPEPAVHKGQYGTGCEQCHTTRTWEDIKPLHDVGDFSLRGQHNNIACERCHRDNRPLAGSGNLCINCHRNDDIHSNSLSPRCGDCHTQWSFAPARFDHSRVGCNLTGLHRTLSCFGCHRNGNFAGLSGECGSCHRDDAAKAGLAGGTDHTKLPGGCATCHNANTWKPATGSGRESVCR
ncbi:MAG: cytochrome c3 family protein [Deltaproteobacteria bacterium]|nr:cytochrome c3 family protein [Deltaproteobacteria bacterium]MCW5801945.1 cytochrome c3 family protein [Deltaproteobacteria bacterium]